jgi:Tetratricopeptide repeat
VSDQGKYEEAEEMQRQALRLSETVLAGVLSDQGKYEEAEKNHR